jgi:hypothetical protein
MVHRQLPPNFWDDDFDGLSDAAAASGFLQTKAHTKVRQTAGTVAHTQRPFENWQTPQRIVQPGIRIPMTEIRYALEKYDQIFLLPQYHLCEWMTTSSWAQTWWDCHSPITDIWIYHDGSHRDNGAGAAAVAFLRRFDAI